MSTFQKAWKTTGVTLAYVGLAGIIWTAILWELRAKNLPRAPEDAYVGLAGIIWTAILWELRAKNLPRAPEDASGRIYSRNTHGVIVYQNRSEYHFLETVHYCSNGSVCI